MGSNAAEFSGFVAQHRGLVEWSPDGLLLAVCCGTRLTVRRKESLEVLVSATCLDKVEAVSWSPDSGYLLCALYQRGIVQAFSVHDPEWTCKVSEGLAGCVHACWAPDSRHLLTVADFQAHLAIWSLVDGGAVYVAGPKLRGEGLAFSPDGRFLAVATRAEGRDAVEVLDGTRGWELVSRFATGTHDLGGLRWSPDGSTLAACESLLQYGVRFFAADGRLLEHYCAYENALGVKTMDYSPSGDLLAVGSYDEAVRLLHAGSWRCMATKAHSLQESPPETVFVEQAVGQGGGGGGGGSENEPPATGNGRRPGPAAAAAKAALEPAQITFDTTLPADLPRVPVDPARPAPHKGVGLLAWSADGRFLATRNDNQPNVVWVWDAERLALQALLVLLAPVFSARWDPRSQRLAVCTGGTRVYFWSPDGASWVDVPAAPARGNVGAAPRFQLRGLRWAPSGDSLALLGRGGSFCCCYL